MQDLSIVDQDIDFLEGLDGGVYDGCHLKLLTHIISEYISVMAASAPSLSKVNAIPRPTPCPAPMTMATFPSSLPT